METQQRVEPGVPGVVPAGAPMVPIDPDPAPVTGGQAEPSPAGVAHEVTQLAQELMRHSRVLHLMKLRLGEVMPPGLDWAAFGLLAQLARCGPSRQADLAEKSLLDPSTISRHAGQLVRARLVERRADPEDGRAVQLVATEQGRAVLDAAAQRRDEAFRTALAGWRSEDLRTLIELLSRFNDDLEAFRQRASRAGPPPGT